MRGRKAVKLREGLPVPKRSAREKLHQAGAALELLARIRRHGSAAAAILAPEHIRRAASAIEHPREDEQEVREPVEILARAVAHRFARGQTHNSALGATADRTRDVREARRARAAGQD